MNTFGSDCFAAKSGRSQRHFQSRLVRPDFFPANEAIASTQVLKSRRPFELLIREGIIENNT
jgi:hypothetical protein